MNDHQKAENGKVKITVMTLLGVAFCATFGLGATRHGHEARPVPAARLSQHRKYKKMRC